MTRQHHFLFIFIFIAVSALALSGCVPNLSSPPPADSSAAAEPTSTTEKSGFTTLSGTLQATSTGAGLLQTDSGPVAVESLSVVLSDYNGQTVTVTGKYSGDTLFVSEIN